jgi:hypothetical protein
MEAYYKIAYKKRMGELEVIYLAQRMNIGGLS